MMLDDAIMGVSNHTVRAGAGLGESEAGARGHELLLHHSSLSGTITKERGGAYAFALIKGASAADCKHVNTCLVIK